MTYLSPRQIHLDFHTSEKIPSVAEMFDPAAFAQTAKDAHVSSMTVFARCHHGMLYYDSKLFPERVHPGLKNKNLLVDQVRALHAAGIKAPVYITVQWDYYTATRHPEWLIRKADGSHEGDPFTQAGFYQSLCVNTGYRDFLKAQTIEVMELLGDELDGLFFDIVGIRPCLCAECRRQMEEMGIDMNKQRAVREFAHTSMNGFRADMSALVRAHNPNCTIFYNAGHVGSSTRDSVDAYSHFELESLPSGGWGYLHFPVTARYARKLGLDCMGMTGKFHTSWGDFHSLKNQAALEFEAFRMLAFGFACSIGDQLEPCGKLNPAAYRLIGSVYSRFEELESWARPGRAMTEAALITGESEIHESMIPDSILGASQLLDEISVQFDILDMTMALDGYRLVILPDDLAITPEFAHKLDAYQAAGGHILSCGRGGLTENCEYPACFKVKYAGEAEEYPDFIVPEGALTNDLEQDAEYVIYERGARIESSGAEPCMYARAPYFTRTGEHFCSHRYTPSAHGEKYPVGFRAGGVITLSHPLFTQYRDNSPLWVKRIINAAIEELMPDRLVSHDGASTISVYLLDQSEKSRFTAHVLSYIPVRKNASFDIIEERTKVRGLTLTINEPFKTARLAPGGEELKSENGRVFIPEVDGYAVIELDR